LLRSPDNQTDILIKPSQYENFIFKTIKANAHIKLRSELRFTLTSAEPSLCAAGPDACGIQRMPEQ